MLNKSLFIKIAKITWALFGVGLFFIALWIVAIQDDFGGYFGGMPDLKELENPNSNVASEIYSADGILMGKYYRENRTPVPLDEISPNVVNALIATEDIRFREHSGIDLISLMRVFRGIITFHLDGGGSTISQQLAKNLFNTRTKQYNGTWTTPDNSKILRMGIIKFKEWMLSVKLERSYTKDEILYWYLNTVDFGRNAFGIKVAAKTYFDREPIDLTLPEAATLVGMLKAPTAYNAIGNPERSKFRRNVVFKQMEKYKYITPEERTVLKEEPMVTNENFSEVDAHHNGLAPYLRTVVRNKVMRWCKDNDYDLFSDGLRIYTTIDSRMQKHAEGAVKEHMKELQGNFFDQWKGKNPWRDEYGKEIEGFLEKATRQTERYRLTKIKYDGDSTLIAQEMAKQMNESIKMKVFDWNSKGYEKDSVMTPLDSIKYYKHFMHIGMMVMDPHSGQIKAWVGGINHKHFQFDHVQQGRRQPGSTFKPIVYATAISEKKFHPCFQVTDVPKTFNLESGGTWTARNSGGYTGQTMTLRQGLARSVNTIAAYLIGELGEKEGANKVIKLARRMGIEAPLNPVPSLALGSSEVSVYEMVGAYSTFNNEGEWTEPIFITRIEDKNGRVLRYFSSKTKPALSKDDAATMMYMLMGAGEERGGTALGLWKYKFRKAGVQIAGKTGTTQNYSDGWFMGMTKNLVVGTWVGGDDRSIHFNNFAYGQGSRMAMPAYGMFMDSLYMDSTITDYVNPKEKLVDKSKLSIETDCGKYNRSDIDTLGRNLMPVRGKLEDDIM
ncbi:membrane carboxypeptidase/penicillin-binding protein [Bernardetia litoralis DSM 6794]|uniref:Membrane carboxypeptidase/penicillin-binding protein n=1 Tax=Bernardetia litoralis (strain ATCC 23117 / DSM 6794 / NBRC 15988 / NCIMB 1366 / Fx l1 / Sio-4) TaxID=880071 RepID=I4AH27_BERLS|nr:transglycosylase domain-containing protein [Bernardetia litoralis]AFM03262.1 membrane carboxypeptidase/penicillin-binding protein [Bernardetia litoralis DSM 6794]